MAEEEEYESDPEEVKPMRRRQASDDEEEGEGDTDGDKSPLAQLPARCDSRSDVESDGQGGVAVYHDNEAEEEELDEEEDYVVDDDDGLEERVEVVGYVGLEPEETMKESDGERMQRVEEPFAKEGEEEKKENEPFAVPTAGAFYMHDDRFRDTSRGRNRRFLGGRKVWESKDDRKWGHDKFEEMTSQERRYAEGGSNSKGQYRARNRNRGTDQVYARGSRTRVHTNHQIDHVPKDFRGRGPRRYEPPLIDEGPQTQNKRPGNYLDKSSQRSSHRPSVGTSNEDSDHVLARNQVFASSLNSASPPFYPSGSSNKEINLLQRKGVQGGVANRNSRVQVMDDRFPMPQSSAMLRKKNIVDSTGMDKLYIDDSAPPISGKSFTNMQLATSGSSLNNAPQHPHSRLQGKCLAQPGQMNFQPNPSHSQVSRAPATRFNAAQQSSVQNRAQACLQSPVQVSGQQSADGSRSSSPPNTVISVNSFEPKEIESPPESSKSKNALVGKGKGSGNAQGSGRGSFLYNEAQAVGASGNMGVCHGDQNFPATPTFLPVMQFGGQHPGGMGVPAVGMAFPGYVAQPQLGGGNSEMTWLPILAGAGALGASYCPPYMAIDGTFQARPSSHAPSAGASSKENSTSKPNNEWKPSQRPELPSDEFGQRQNKPRRYSEMNFGQ